ncbi:hypothetical protein DAI22_10g091901 [Oryza sativa Japonica Group]|nr:hypothetical protein DAI22_10g091901 [Oryza sativa Japonica Group]
MGPTSHHILSSRAIRMISGKLLVICENACVRSHASREHVPLTIPCKTEDAEPNFFG